MKNLFADRLNELLEEKNISKRECARLTGISAQSISDWTTGKITPTAENVYIIAEQFNVSTDYLLGRDDSSNKKITSSLTSKEERLLKAFQFLDNDEQNKIIEDCEYFANKHNNKNKIAK